MTSVRPRRANPTWIRSSASLSLVLPGAIVAAGLVIAIGAVVRLAPGINRAEQPVTACFNNARTGVFGGFTTAVYHGLEPVFAVLITAAVAAIVWIVTRRLRTAVTFAAVVAATWLPVAIFKVLFVRARPNALLLPHPVSPAPIDASYPSGHVAFATAIAMTFVLIARSVVTRMIAVAAGAIAVVVVTLSVLVDGVHFPTDVVASIVWGIGVAPLVWFIWRRLTDRIGRRSDV